MVKAILSGDSYHVLEVMHGFHDSSEQGLFYHMESTCERPKPLPVDNQF